jgi:NifU-like protein involved in Fe-S cluster formation
MMDELYSREILRLTTDLRRGGRLKTPHGTATCTARLCGSTITVDIELDENLVSNFAIEVKACALGQACAALVSQHIIGATIDEVNEAFDAIKSRLSGGDRPYPARFEALKILDSVKDYPARHASTMLCLEATTKAISAGLVRGHENKMT